jgi:hypothetical protein
MCLSDDDLLVAMTNDEVASSHVGISSRASAFDRDEVDNSNNNRNGFMSSVCDKSMQKITSRHLSTDDASQVSVSDHLSLPLYPDVAVGIVGLTVIAVAAYFFFQRFRRVL